ncbi:MAG: C2 family cysteine protease [Isosphaeraceae bacterium]
MEQPSRDRGNYRPCGLWVFTLAPAFLGVTAATSRMSAQPAGPGFAQVVARNFRAWDLNRDGRIGAAEIDRLMTVPSIRGDDAAALATLKLRERKTAQAVRPQFAVGMEHVSGQVEIETPLTRADPANEDERGPFHFDRQFRAYRSTLSNSPRRLFAGDGPDFHALQQGPIGDCFLFSMAGSLAAREPGRIASMISRRPGGGYLVRFPGGRSVSVPPLTQAEALVNNSASTLSDGVWTAVLEKAVGEVFREEGQARPGKATAEPTDEIASGGSSVRVIHLFTGHATHHVALRDRRAEAGRTAEVRRLLPEALARGRLAAVTMGKLADGAARVPGLGYHHVYAVLGFDRSRDVVTLWNPWGNTFTPKGPDGPEHGFTTRHGVLKIPVATLYQTFTSVYIETNQPVDGGSRPGPYARAGR